jgi:hypothetical protein
LAVVKQDDEAAREVERALHRDGAGLSEAHRSATMLADDLMTRPGDIDDATVAALRAQFTDEQLVELTLKVLKFNVQKVQVALGTHDWITEEKIDTLAWNRDGTYVTAD